MGGHSMGAHEEGMNDVGNAQYGYAQCGRAQACRTLYGHVSSAIKKIILMCNNKKCTVPYIFSYYIYLVELSYAD